MLRRLGWFALLVVLYLWFVDEAIASEALFGLGAAFAVSLFLERIRRIAGDEAGVPWRGVGQALARVPTGLAYETWLVLGPVLWRAVRGRTDAGGRWIAVRYEPADDTAGRRSLVVLGSGITPNAIPLAIEPEHARMVLHQLQPIRDPGADHARFPL